MLNIKEIDDKVTAFDTACLQCMNVAAGCIMEVVATATGIRRMVDSCRAVEHQVKLTVKPTMITNAFAAM